MSNPIQQVQQLGQSIWYDNMRRGLLASGELERLIEQGISGLTSNPTIFEKAIAGSTDYDDALLALARAGTGVDQIYESLVVEDIQAAADLLRPTFDRSGGADGHASLEVSPALAHDADGTVTEARRLFAAVARPNAMIKVPGTPEGIGAFRRLIAEGININVTLIFSLQAYAGVREAYVSGLEELVANGGDPEKVASVASFFVSRVDTAVDSALDALISAGGPVHLKGLQGKAGIANARLAYQAFKDTFKGDHFAALRERGARVQRPLWASTGTKNPALSDVLYVEALIGRDTVNTVPPATLTAFLDHGRPGPRLEQEGQESEMVMASLEEAGVRMEAVTDKLLAAGLKSFAESFDMLMENIEDKKTKLLASEHAHPGVSLGDLLPEVESTLARMQRDEVMSRIWRKDHTVWQEEPTEVVDRLGWLHISEAMAEQAPALREFAEEARNAGFHHAVLLGMGGSSLGPEVLRQTFGKADGFLELIVLDSTLPGAVRAVTESIDPAHTLFIVSSKSGGTIEPLSFYRHFRGLVEQAVGKEKAGQSFVAITDPGTSLEALANAQGFRRVFTNATDIGGRYSVLSYFGLVPAALMGMDVVTLLERADRMLEGSQSCVPAHDNPGAWLGSVLGVAALRGRDKLTLVTSPTLGGFGLWVEQLIAESTGKQGKGIVPIAGEPLLGPEHYGDDRIFVYARLDQDDNGATDAAVQRLQESGQPVVRLGLRDRYDLGAEFFRWEFATSVAGAILGIQPFDQPNVQQAKDLTARVLKEHQASGALPKVEVANSLKGLLAGAVPGDYVAIMAYVPETAQLDSAFDDLRRHVMEHHRVATTMGYGPRFLHSTGQLHKGGPGTGLYLQITAANGSDLSIPGAPYSFGLLAAAQALGDLQALQEAGRRVVRVQLDGEHVEAIRSLTRELG